MAADADATSDPQELSIFDFRRLARRRSWLCPGMGFALFGHRDAALVTYGLGLGATAAAILAVLNPSLPLFLGVLVLVVLSTLFWIAELVTTYMAWPSSLEVPRGNGHIVRAAVLWGSFVMLAATVLATYGLLEVGGEGMSPLVHQGDKLLYRRQSDRNQFAVGDIVLFRLTGETKFAEAGTLMIGRIMAGPGDKIYRREKSYYVNDVINRDVAPESYPLALEIARYPQQTTVPDDCYFIVQDSMDRALDSRVLGWGRRTEMLSSELYLLRGLPPWRRIE